MKPLSFLILFFLTTVLSAQVSIDSVRIIYNSSGPDSVYIRYTSYLNEMNLFGSTIFNNNGCHSQHSNIDFSGPITSNPIIRDSIFRLGYPGFKVQLFQLQATWDTAKITGPGPRLVMDTYLYDSCSVVGIIENNLGFKASIFPNPAQDYFQIKGSSLMEIKSIQVYDIRGQQAAQYHTVQDRYYVTDLPNGIYLIRMETEQGRMSERLLIQR